ARGAVDSRAAAGDPVAAPDPVRTRLSVESARKTAAETAESSAKTAINACETAIHAASETDLGLARLGVDQQPSKRKTQNTTRENKTYEVTHETAPQRNRMPIHQRTGAIHANRRAPALSPSGTM